MEPRNQVADDLRKPDHVNAGAPRSSNERISVSRMEGSPAGSAARRLGMQIQQWHDDHRRRVELGASSLESATLNRRPSLASLPIDSWSPAVVETPAAA